MKNIKLIFSLIIAGMVLLVSCSDEKLGKSIFDTNPPARNSFDTWLLNNFVKVYNVETLYKYEDIEATNAYNVIPANLKECTMLAQIVKNVWYGAYDELLGVDFLKSYSPRTLQYIGSYAYSQLPNGSAAVTMGSAEGGMKVTLYGVNSLSLNPDYLNTAYFHTMHHEFTHILNQKIPYDREFKRVTPGDYNGREWIYWVGRTLDYASLSKGFISAYAMSEFNEDFCEIYSIYVTSTKEKWTEMMNFAAKDSVKYSKENTVITTGEVAWYSNGRGRELIEKKLEFVRNYFLLRWGLDMDQMRAVVLRRGYEIPNMQFETFDDLYK